ncbi:MAG: RIP metalloprotease RseP [Deltaproteobacteria bacterium]|jgi:regulator of sigma E protease|nr:RIP metalloprotease RseP [Deltaproteobacteria bacterium]
MFISILSVVLVLGGLIFFHELGHFLAARAFGMGVSTFSLGFGPKLVRKLWGKTEYCLSAFPLGGYVSLVGQDEEEELPEGFTKEEYFSPRPPWQRLIVVAAGPLANLLLAWLLCWGLVYAYGEVEVLPKLGALEENGPAAKAGMRPGDLVLAVNGVEIQNWRQLAGLIAASGGESVRLDIARSGNVISSQSHMTNASVSQSLLSVTATPEPVMRKSVFGEDVPSFRIGIRASGAYSIKKQGFFEAAVSGVARSGEMLALTWQGIVKLAQRVVPLDQVGGPILIAQMLGRQAKESLEGLLAMAALISINLAVLNLLPIPVLDGGHIFFFSLETLMRRPLNRAFRNVTTRLGVAFLFCLMLLATFNDILRLIKVE